MKIIKCVRDVYDVAFRALRTSVVSTQNGTNYEVLSNFQKISKDFRKHSEHCPKVVRKFPIIFRTVLMVVLSLNSTSTF